GTLMLWQSTVSANVAKAGNGGPGTYSRSSPSDGGNGANAVGGGIYNAGTLTLLQSTISGNRAIGGNGGSGYVSATFNGYNGVSGIGNGGGIFNVSNCVVRNSLIALNTVTNGGFSPMVNNNPDLAGSFTSQGNNLVSLTGDSQGFVNGINADLVGTTAAPINPLLGLLANNGGLTLTLALQAGSPAIDAGSDAIAGTYDQRGSGFPRISGQHIDIGAYEFQTTGYSAPTIVSQSAGTLTVNPSTALGSLTINATINPNNLASTAWIQYGATTAYGAATTPVALGYGNSNVSTNFPLGNLPSGVTIHYRLIAANAAGTTNSSDQTIKISATGDFNGDSTVSQSELNAVYAGFVTNSAWLNLTNTAGLGQTNATFTLADPISAGYGYTVEYSTNLVNWSSLGTATPRYQITDTNATGPVRYYRLRYP
ncbi:MAG TPA: choice-of-anchor Q domain-containing protein, partial [Desulfuromonadaceae bacterium]|nr:choice-of-anchor Q domain-containing protein [Desulfuromonadaceae bacterium]